MSIGDQARHQNVPDVAFRAWLELWAYDEGRGSRRAAGTYCVCVQTRHRAEALNGKSKQCKLL